MAIIRQKPETYAITLLTHQRRRHFQRIANADLFLTTLFRYRDEGRFQVHAFAVMPDHIHVVITPAMDQSTARCIQCMKGGYSHAAGAKLAGVLWQSGSHEHRIRDRRDYENQVIYIARNPERKNLIDHRHVHTHPAYAGWLDLPPEHLG